jgi:butyryl-CoA dehydrogenase
MMDDYLDDTHVALRAVVRDFAANEFEPHVDAWNQQGELPIEAVRAMGDLGLFGIPFPEPYGSGGDLRSLCVAIEEIARVDQSLAITLEAGVGLGIAPLVRFGTAEQQEQFLPALCAGRALAAFGLTEPDAGSDAGGTRTRAQLDASSDAWVLDGEKAFITNAGTSITSLVTVTARTAPQEISTLLVPAGTPGLHVHPGYRKIGWHASDTHGISLSSCRVPSENLLGTRGRGMAQFLAVLGEGRIAIASLAVGVIQRCLDDSVAYAAVRHAFGRPIGSNQGIAFRVVDVLVSLESARLLTYRAAALRDNGQPYKRAAAVAKLYATEAAVSATRQATQVFGGSGFMEETSVARHYRDAKILEIGEGTSEIQRIVIARELGLPVL